MSYHYFPTPCPHCGGTGSAESCPDRPAAAHAGEPQAGEKPSEEAVMWLRRKYWHYCETERKHDAEISAELLHFLDGPEPIVGGGSIETAAQQALLGLPVIVRAYLTGLSHRCELQQALDNLDRASRGTTNETGKEPKQAQATGPQSNRQHAGEGKAKTESEERLIIAMLEYASTGGQNFPLYNGWFQAVIAERAPLVERPREGKA